MIPQGYIKLEAYEARLASRMTVLRNFFAAAHKYFKKYTDRSSRYGARAPYNAFEGFDGGDYGMLRVPIAWQVGDHMRKSSAINIINNFVTYARMKGVVVVAKYVNQFYVRCTFNDAFDNAIIRKTEAYKAKEMDTALFTDGTVNQSNSMQAIDSVFFEIAEACEDLNIVKLLFDVKTKPPGGGQFHKIGLQYFKNNRANYATTTDRFKSVGVFWMPTFKSFEIFPSASLMPDIGILDTYMCHKNSYITNVIHGLADIVENMEYGVRSIPDPNDVTTTDPPLKPLTELQLAYPTFMTQIRQRWMRSQRLYMPNKLIPSEPQSIVHTMKSQYMDGFLSVASRIGDPNVQNNVLHFFMTRYMELP
jgi:hypothetical protein